MGLLAGVLVGGATQLLNDKPRTPDEVFWSTVEEARKLALKSGQDVAMTFVDDREQGKGFALANGSAAKLFSIPQAGDLEVTFLSQQKGGSSGISTSPTSRRRSPSFPTTSARLSSSSAPPAFPMRKRPISAAARSGR